VYGGRSRFMSDKVLQAFEQSSYSGSHIGDSALSGTAGVKQVATVDAAARLKDMW
jgi:hypothetical protein